LEEERNYWHSQAKEAHSMLENEKLKGGGWGGVSPHVINGRRAINAVNAINGNDYVEISTYRLPLIALMALTFKRGEMRGSLPPTYVINGTIAINAVIRPY
jgi:hypothetical protein